jgi:hypothetical protein
LPNLAVASKGIQADEEHLIAPVNSYFDNDLKVTQTENIDFDGVTRSEIFWR